MENNIYWCPICGVELDLIDDYCEECSSILAIDDWGIEENDDEW